MDNDKVRQSPRGLEFTPDQMRSLCVNVLDVDYQLHSVDYKAIGLEGFGKLEGYVKRQARASAWTSPPP